MFKLKVLDQRQHVHDDTHAYIHAYNQRTNKQTSKHMQPPHILTYIHTQVEMIVDKHDGSGIFTVFLTRCVHRHSLVRYLPSLLSSLLHSLYVCVTLTLSSLSLLHV